MKNIDLEYLCSVIAGLSGIPVRIFDTNCVRTLSDRLSGMREARFPA